ncbi:hypothetical protein BD408DRAFT_450273 [Parasitella parasitica]|nr:hypothetical protein BD408DRAFT_450273 [Parasitella parasitica]
MNPALDIRHTEGQGHVVDGHGIELMELVDDGELYAIETTGSQTQFLMNKPPERPSNPVILPVADERNCDVDMGLRNKRRYTVYSDEDKIRFFYLFFSKCLNASAIARQLGVFIMTKTLKEKRKNQDEVNPFAVVNEVVKSLKQNYEDLNVSSSIVYNFIATLCNLSFKQAQLHPVERNRFSKNTTVFKKWQQTDLDFTTNCVFHDELALHITKID